MNKISYCLLVVAALASASASASERMRFWNLTDKTITVLSLAQPGSKQWGPNQCDNDRDKSVDPDERLALKGIAPGLYDVKLQDTSGRVCIVRNVTVRDDDAYAFSLESKDLTDCKKSAPKDKK